MPPNGGIIFAPLAGIRILVGVRTYIKSQDRAKIEIEQIFQQVKKHPISLRQTMRVAYLRPGVRALFAKGEPAVDGKYRLDPLIPLPISLPISIGST